MLHYVICVVGIIASGLFLFLVAFLGLIAGSKHHQVLLFFVSFCCGLPYHDWLLKCTLFQKQFCFFY